MRVQFYFVTDEHQQTEATKSYFQICLWNQNEVMKNILIYNNLPTKMFKKIIQWINHIFFQWWIFSIWRHLGILKVKLQSFKLTRIWSVGLYLRVNVNTITQNCNDLHQQNLTCNFHTVILDMTNILPNGSKKEFNIQIYSFSNGKSM